MHSPGCPNYPSVEKFPFPRLLASFVVWLCAILLSVTTATAAELPAASAPGEVWKIASPESQGLSSAKLEAVRAGLAARNTQAFLVIRNDAIVCEWYSPDFSA